MSLIEFNIFVKIFDKINEFDVRDDYSIIKVKNYVCKKLNININDFDMYIGDKKIDYGVIGDYNMKEDMIINVYPIIKTGINKLLDKTNIIKYDSLDEVKDYIFNNINEEEKEVVVNKTTIIDIKREEENMNTRNKIQDLLKIMNKK